MRYLRAARQLGDLLIVGVLTARATLEKKPMPIMSCTHRMELVRALQCVDSVTEQYQYSPLENIRRLCPDILIESEGHADQPANDFVRSYGGKVVVLPYTPGMSSSRYKERIVYAAKKNKHA